MKNSFISSFENNGKYRVRITYVALFIIILLSSLALMEVVNRNLLSKHSLYAQTLRYFNKQKESVELLFLGDSHFALGINLKFFDQNTFNLSFGGASTIQSYYILKKYIEEMKSLKFVVLQVDLHTFSSFRTAGIVNPYFWNQFTDYSELSKIVGLGILKNKYPITVLREDTGERVFIVKMSRCALRLLPFKRLDSIRAAIAEQPWDEEIGRRRLPDSGQVLNKRMAVRSAEAQFENWRVPDKNLLIYFEKILRLCEENNVKVITVQMPMSRDYLITAEKYITGEMLRNAVIENPHYGDYIYKNLDHLGDYLDNDEFFTEDGHHLNKKGRDVFSELLSQEISMEE